MEVIKTILEFVFVSCIIGIIYCFYQAFRNSKVYSLRSKWRFNNDNKWQWYSYYEMFNPSKKNYYGLRYPRDKHFKK